MSLKIESPKYEVAGMFCLDIFEVSHISKFRGHAIKCENDSNMVKVEYPFIIWQLLEIYNCLKGLGICMLL